MRKKLIAAIICMSMICLSVANVGAYLVGEPTWLLKTSDCVSVTGGSISAGSLILSGGGTAVYDFRMPFDAVSVDIAYQAEADVNLTISRDAVSNIAVSAEQASVHYDFVAAERKGTSQLTISSDSEITISEIKFTKEDIATPTNKTLLLPNISEEERAIEASILLDTNSSIIIVRGGKRYIDYGNTAEKLSNIEGTTYLPAKTLAYALGCYLEDMPDKNYLLLRKGCLEYIYKDGSSKIRENSGAWVDIECPVIYQDGRAYLPVRKTAETFGFTVGYKNGIIAIDEDKFTVKNILEAQTVFDFVNNSFAPYRGAAVKGNTYYVAQSWNADDNNTGTIDKPFKTLAKAASTAKAGDTVIIREGIYREILAPQNSGEPNAPITFMAAENEEVVLSANEPLTQVTDYENGLLAYSMAWDMGEGRNQIFYKGEALAEGRYPNGNSIIPGTDRGEYGDLFPTLLAEQTMDIKGYKFDPLTDESGELRVEVKPASKTVVSKALLYKDVEDYWAGGTYVSCHGYAWTLSAGKIDSSGVRDNGVGYLELGNVSDQWWDDIGREVNPKNNGVNYGYITNHVGTIDLPGEWTVSDHQLIIKPPKGESKETLKLEAKARQIVANLENNNHIHLRGIKTIGGGMKLNNSNMCVIDGADMSYISHFTFFEDSRNGYIDDNNSFNPEGAPPSGEMGIFIGGSDNAIVNSRLDYSAGAGIYGTGTYAYLENNIISNCGYMGHYVSGVTFSTEDWKSVDEPRGGFAILGNTIYNSGRSVINVSACEQWINADNNIVPYLPFEVAYNKLYNGILTGRDGGVTYEYGIIAGHERLSSVYHNNMVYTDVPSTRHLSVGIYHDGHTQGIDTFENIIFTTQPDVIYNLDDIYIQTEAGVASNCREWNNSELGNFTPGEAGLTPSDYPYGKPFFTGSKLDAEPYLVNYNNAFTDVGCVLPSEYSDGIETDSGVAEFTANEQWIKFENVDFGGVDNILEIHFKGDRYNTGDKIEVIVGDTIEGGLKYTHTLTANAINRYDNNVSKVNLANYGLNKETIFIRMKDLKTAAIDKVSTSRFIINEALVAQVFGGAFTEVVTQGAGVPTAKWEVPGDKVNAIVNNTWMNTIIKYEDIKLTEDVNTMEICATSYDGSTKYAGQTLEIRIDAWNGPLVASYVVQNDGWSTYIPRDVELAEPLKAGVYDFYVVAKESPTTAAPTSNLYYFGFKNQSAE